RLSSKNRSVALKNFSQLEHEIEQQGRSKTILLFLDYDGTLTPIAQTPEEAILPHENQSLLKHLSNLSFCQVVIITGRALADIKKMVSIEEIIYVGNHGWEIEGSQIHFNTLLSPEILSTMDSIKYELVTKLYHIEGVF